MSGRLPLSQMPVDSKWRHGPTYVYDMNYGYGMNYYQPMIDYIDRRQVGAKSEYPHLPWSDGRLVWESNEVLPYTKPDLVRRAVDAELQAKQHLAHFKVRRASSRWVLRQGWVEGRDRFEFGSGSLGLAQARSSSLKLGAATA
ncbi:paramyosin, short form [Orussus abietinus]|uniref:paramyosin, short form n=1 Tax=Orussus abietinus TaxID=222816 RepID=UPI000626CD30|nr:paramyosin, short form [Orussus abietinus]